MFSEYPTSLTATPSHLLESALTSAGLASDAVHGLPLLAEAADRFTADYTGSLDACIFNLPLRELRDAASARSDWYAGLSRAVSIDHAVAVASREFQREIPGDSSASKFARITDPSFWRRHYATNAKRAHEFAYIRTGFVSGAKERYVSDSTLSLYRNYRESQQQFLNSYYVVDRKPNSMGEHSRRLLADLAKSEEAKRAKLWAFLSGIEQLSVEAGLSCALLTLTLPASFHANPTTGGSSYDGVSTPQDGGRYLAMLWNKIQRDLHNEGIAVSGARFVEPHKDGTPHWHLWMHYQQAYLPRILAVIARYFPGDASKRVAAVRVRTVEADPRGKLYNKKDGSRFTECFQRFDPATVSLKPASSRFKAQVDLSVINRAYANGATYASKYAMKTLQPGEGSEAERVAASRWIWRLRSFAFFGIRNCLGAWDELYRAKEVPTDPTVKALFNAVHEKPGKHTKQVRNRATGRVEEIEVEGGTAAFLRLQGGLSAADGLVPCDHIRVRLIYKPVLNRYGDAVRVKVGMMVVRDDEYLYSATTREPGRFVLLSERNIDAAIASLAPLDSELVPHLV